MSVQRVQRGDQRSDQRRRQPVRVRSLNQADVRPLRGREKARERRGVVAGVVIVDVPAASPASTAPASASKPASPASSAAAAAPPGVPAAARSPAALPGEAPVQPGEPRGCHRGGELLVSLPRGRRLEQPGYHQLGEPTRVLHPHRRQQRTSSVAQSAGASKPSAARSRG